MFKIGDIVRSTAFKDPEHYGYIIEVNNAHRTAIIKWFKEDVFKVPSWHFLFSLSKVQ